MVTKLTRRLRCEVQGCREIATYGLGVKGYDYPLCEKHFRQLVEEGNEIFNVVPEPVEIVEEVAVEVAPVVEETAKVEEVPEEFFECKYCGEKFPKSEYTVAQFAAHVKKCKKEHSAE